MQAISNDLQQWIQRFIGLSYQSAGVQKKFEDQVLDDINNVTHFIKVCAEILLINADTEAEFDIAKEMSLTVLNEILITKDLKDMMEKKAVMFEYCVSLLKEAVKMNIFSPNLAILENSIKCYSRLFSILTNSWTNGLTDIITSFSNSEYLPNGINVLFSIMRNIVNVKNFEKEIWPNFTIHFCQVLSNSMFILSKEAEEQLYTIELRIEAGRYLCDLVSVCPAVLNEGEAVGFRIPLVLESLHNSFKINDSNLILVLHKIILVIVKNFYSLVPRFMEQILRLVLNGLQTTNDTEIINLSIDFWREFAAYEHDVIEQINKIQQNANISHEQITNMLIPNLIPVFIKYIESIKEDDFAVENPQERKEPSMFATVAITSFYRNAPAVVFELLKDKIEEELTIENWTKKHAGLLMIYAIIEKPLNDHVFQLVNHLFDLMTNFITQDNVPRLRETALYVISQVISNYPQVISHAGDKMIDRVERIIFSIEPIQQVNQDSISYDDSQIFCRYESAVSCLCCASPMAEYFEILCENAFCLFNIGVSSNKENLLISSNQLLCVLIFCSKPDDTDLLDYIYFTILTMLIRLNGIDCIDEVQSSLFTVIEALLDKLALLKTDGQEIFSKYAEQTLKIIFDSMVTKQSKINKSGLSAISKLINETTQIDNETIIKEFIIKGLNMFPYQAEVIMSTCNLIKRLFEIRQSQIIDLNRYVPAIFNAFTFIILNDEDEMIETHVVIMKTVADILNGTLENVQMMDNLKLSFEQLFATIYDNRFKFELSDEQNVNYINQFYKHLTDAVGGYAKAFIDKYDVQLQRNQLIMLDKLAQLILLLSEKIDLNLYTSFAETAIEFSKSCLKQNLVLLLRQSVHRILTLGVTNVKHQSLSEKLSETSKCLREIGNNY